MRRITAILADAPAGGDSVRLDHDLRNRRRMVFKTAEGNAILLDMARPVHLHDGDGLELEDGSIVRVEAAAEALVEITAPDLPALVRIAWHLGNRHLPTQLLGDRLRIREDHVIADMVAGLGGNCAAIMAPFDPEGGAYASADQPGILAHHHGHGHEHDRDHGHHHG
jgi:urease accessory protein